MFRWQSPRPMMSLTILRRVDLIPSQTEFTAGVGTKLLLVSHGSHRTAVGTGRGRTTGVQEPWNYQVRELQEKRTQHRDLSTSIKCTDVDRGISKIIMPGESQTGAGRIEQ